jgi:hypothetical protein
VVLQLMHGTRVAAHIELKNTRNHNDGLGPMSIFEQRETERFCTADEEAAAKMLLVLNNPVSLAVLTDEKKGRFRLRSRRGRFLLAHDTFPALYSAAGCWPAAWLR